MFNAVLKDFLSELRGAFPDNEEIHNAKKKIKQVTKVSPEIPCRLFREVMKPFEEMINEKNETFFHGEANDLLKKTLGLNIQSIWTDASEETKECIWNHIRTLFMVSSKDINVTPDAMQEIQKLAHQMSTSVNPADFQDPSNMKQTLENLAQSIDTSAIHSIVSQIDPNLAKEMLPSLESGELMKGVTSMIQNMDPSTLNAMSGIMSNPESMDMSKMMSSMMENIDPNMMMKMMQGFSGPEDLKKLM